MLRILIVILALTVNPASTDAVDVTNCATTIPEAETGVLTADLDCSGSGTFAVRLLRRAVLDLNGHTLTGGPGALEPTVVGVRDADEHFDGSGPAFFEITGPGAIVGTASDPDPFTGQNACILVNDGRARITSPTGVVEIHGCHYGVFGGVKGPNLGGRARVEMDHVDLHDNWTDGVVVHRLVASNVMAYNHARGIGLAAQRMNLTEVTAHHNNTAIAADRVRGFDVTVVDNVGPNPNAAGGNGINCSKRAVVTNLVAMNNQNPGVTAVRMLLVDSQVTGNGLGPTHHMVDLLSRTKPKLVNTVCLHSEVTADAQPLPPTFPDWGVCAND